jgi:hypothetical protein
MTSRSHLRNSASELVDAAGAFDRAADLPGSHAAAPESLASLQEALQLLGAAWYRLAADAVLPPGELSREQEVRLIGVLHDVAAAFARCGRACRECDQIMTPLIARKVHAARVRSGQGDTPGFENIGAATEQAA